MTRIAHGLVVAAAAAAFACSGSDNNTNTNTTDSTSTGVAGNREPAAIDNQAEAQRQSLTGCLLAGGDAGNYVLQVARADIPTGIANAAPGAGNAAEGSRTFRLIAAGADDLDSHLNKRVSIEGRIDRGNAPVGTSGVQEHDANRSGTASAQAEGVSPQEMPLVRAESVRTVADDCRATGVR